MTRYSLVCAVATFGIAMVLLLAMPNIAAAQYWFQSGARGSSDSGFNNGAGASIQTVFQNATNGSLGFWVGESLSNGAFIQAGYEITNSTGYYSSSCGNSTKNVFLRAGVPTWFWEYFRPNTDNNSFCGGIGPDGSAGLNGSFNTYAFRSSGTFWNTYFNNQLLGTVNLGTSTSGPNPPSAIAEYAETDTNKWPMSTVRFRNLAFYIGNSSKGVAEGYSVVGYGKGSQTALSNPYGVVEYNNYANYFEVGSKIPVTQVQNLLWEIGYSLSVNSSYGNLAGSGNYVAYSIIPLSAPAMVNVSNGIRELFVGWVGTGGGSYTGNSPTVQLSLYSNTTETAIWQRQYYLNASTPYGTLVGSGWYNANSSIVLSINSNTITIGPSSRVLFNSWSNGNRTKSTTIHLRGPRDVAALWENQYYLDVESQHGTTTGSGWYYTNTSANVSLTSSYVPINDTSRMVFYNWSNGDQRKNTKVVVYAPTKITANFKTQYLVTISPENAYGDNISNISYYNVSGSRINSSSFFVFENKSYDIQYIFYKGIGIATNYRFSTTKPSTIRLKTPIYDISIYTQSVFGSPVNATLNVTFKNNTTVRTHSGQNGLQRFNNVPYGYITGYAEYLGIRESVNANNGFSPSLTFLTESLIEFILIGMLIIVTVAKVVRYYEKRPRSRKSR